MRNEPTVQGRGSEPDYEPIGQLYGRLSRYSLPQRAHLALSLEHLDHLTGKRVTRIGLSATQKPIELVARFLSGNNRPNPVVVKIGRRRANSVSQSKFPVASLVRRLADGRDELATSLLDVLRQ